MDERCWQGRFPGEAGLCSISLGIRHLLQIGRVTHLHPRLTAAQDGRRRDRACVVTGCTDGIVVISVCLLSSRGDPFGQCDIREARSVQILDEADLSLPKPGLQAATPVD